MDHFRFYNVKQKSCSCYSFWVYYYCKHSIAIEDYLVLQSPQKDINLDTINNNKRRGRPKINGPSLSFN